MHYGDLKHVKFCALVENFMHKFHSQWVFCLHCNGRLRRQWRYNPNDVAKEYHSKTNNLYPIHRMRCGIIQKMSKYVVNRDEHSVHKSHSLSVFGTRPSIVGVNNVVTTPVSSTNEYHSNTKIVTASVEWTEIVSKSTDRSFNMKLFLRVWHCSF